MKKLALLAATAAALVLTAGAVAGSPHFVAVSATTSGSTLTVTGKEAGLGNETQVHIEVTATAECINGGGKHPKAVKEIRGRGLLAGLDLVPPVADAVAACRERGLLVLTAGDNTLRLAPPLIVTDNEVARACGIIDAALAGMAS